MAQGRAKLRGTHDIEGKPMMTQDDAINLLAGASHAVSAGDVYAACRIVKYVERNARRAEVEPDVLRVRAEIRGDEPEKRIKVTNPRVG